MTVLRKMRTDEVALRKARMLIGGSGLIALQARCSRSRIRRTGARSLRFPEGALRTSRAQCKPRCMHSPAGRARFPASAGAFSHGSENAYHPRQFRVHLGNPGSIQMKLLELPVLGSDPPHRAGDRAHHHGLGFDHVLAEPYAVEQRPLVTPVAANKQSPFTMSPIPYFLRGSLMPIFPARSRFSSVSSTSRHCIWPPMQRSAAAASTPSGAPPMPI